MDSVNLGSPFSSYLRPNMDRDFDIDSLNYLYGKSLPEAIEAGDKQKAIQIEDVLLKYGWALPNTLTGRWEPLEQVPRDEMQVREMFAHRMPEFGYQIVRSQDSCPDWLLKDKDGNFIYAEVEHRSSNFVTHGHDPGSCDLIVCWEHDEPELPLAVFELFSGELFEPKRKATRTARRDLYVHFKGPKFYPEKHQWLGPRSESRHLVYDNSGNRCEQTYEQVRQLRDEGYKATQAAEVVARRLDVEVSTVNSYVSRYRTWLRKNRT